MGHANANTAMDVDGTAIKAPIAHPLSMAPSSRYNCSEPVECSQIGSCSVPHFAACKKKKKSWLYSASTFLAKSAEGL